MLSESSSKYQTNTSSEPPTSTIGCTNTRRENGWPSLSRPLSMASNISPTWIHLLFPRAYWNWVCTAGVELIHSYDFIRRILLRAQDHFWVRLLFALYSVGRCKEPGLCQLNRRPRKPPVYKLHPATKDDTHNGSSSRVSIWNSCQTGLSPMNSFSKSPDFLIVRSMHSEPSIIRWRPLTGSLKYYSTQLGFTVIVVSADTNFYLF